MAERDSIDITYSILPKYADQANLTATVMLKGCYANSSQTDRPWRKTNPIIAKSKKCPFGKTRAPIALHLPPSASSWRLTLPGPGGATAPLTVCNASYAFYRSSLSLACASSPASRNYPKYGD